MARETKIPLNERIKSSKNSGEIVEGQLLTSDRIIARVTDGIYREPWSAFRELVSNAYDADASLVSIDTDYPFFSEIKITDDGNGMSADILAHMLENIGGSSKRTSEGKKLGTVSSLDPTKSPRGRKLIGKIGIGMFAVAQLTNKFQVISRVSGSDELVSATISIHAYKEDELVEDDAEPYASGSYLVHSEKDPDLDAHGTTIILYSILEPVRRKLQSLEMWETIEEQSSDDSLGDLEILREPTYHIGRVDRKNEIVKIKPRLPWSLKDSPKDKFRGLFRAAMEEKSSLREQKDLSHLDTYLEMIWRLSLSAPLRYIGEHPFELKGSLPIRFFELSNSPKGVAKEKEFRPERSVAHAFKLEEFSNSKKSKFEIHVDGVALSRPVFISSELQGSGSLEKPMLFIGKSTKVFKDIDSKRTGGELSFEAYLYWNSKIIPKESIGALIRVNGASGTLFDPEFLAYKTSEQTRKRQITCEIFVHQGLDGAINIDRESFNSSHPHYLYIQRWLHNSFKQFATQHKRIGRAVREKKLLAQAKFEQKQSQKHVQQIWEKKRGKNLEVPTPEVEQNTSTGEYVAQVGDSKIVWPSDSFIGIGDSDLEREIATILEAYGVLAKLSPAERAALISDLVDLIQIRS